MAHSWSSDLSTSTTNHSCSDLFQVSDKIWDTSCFGAGRGKKKPVNEYNDCAFIGETSSDKTNHSSTSTENEIVLSVYWKRGKLGAAFYSSYDAEVFLLDDVTDIHPDFKNLKALLNQVQYSRIVTCTGLADTFIKTVTDIVNGSEAATEKQEDPPGAASCEKIYFIPGQKNRLTYYSSRKVIMGQRFQFVPNFSNEEDRFLFLNTYIDFKKESMVMSLGILLTFLEKYIPQISLNHDTVIINMLHRINLENLVSMDELSYEALQIFHTLNHPSAYKRDICGSKREGLSVFGVFNRCKSRVGVKKMRQIFTNPMKDISKLNARLDAIEFCTKPKHEHIITNLADCIKKVESVTAILKNVYRSRSNINHWKSLYSSLYNAILIGQICRTYSSHSELFREMAGSITKSVYEVAHYINHVIDFEESYLRNQLTVRSGIDTRLDKMRETYAQVPDVLVKVARLELTDLPEYIEKCSVVYITELGFLLSVPVWRGDGSNVSDYHMLNYETKFIVNKYVYYKTPRCSELDDVLGDVLAKICGVESKIMVALMEFIHERVPDIIHVVNNIAELDCMIAMAAVASENNYCRPVLTRERKLDIIKGRHPLQELCVDNFVANDATFSPEHGAVKILTGPNASGKSVYLKQIAVIVFLAHIGSFVPAQEAVIGILDNIHSRIHTLESVSTRMSSFIMDIKQMSQALYNSTPSTLIVIDEFGKGTTEIDGLSLLAASLIHFLERKENCPFIMVSTHFHITELLPRSPFINFQYMDYIVENEEIVYLHKIKTGTSVSGLSHLAVKKAGFCEQSVKRFMEIFSTQSGKTLQCNTNLEVTKAMLKEVKDTMEFLECCATNGNASRVMDL